MADQMTLATIALAVLAGVIVLALAGLRAWHEWVELQRYALSGDRRIGESGSLTASSAARIELADLRERIRKLEAIATGVDL